MNVFRNSSKHYVFAPTNSDDMHSRFLGRANPHHGILQNIFSPHRNKAPQIVLKVAILRHRLTEEVNGN